MRTETPPLNVMSKRPRAPVATPKQTHPHLVNRYLAILGAQSRPLKFLVSRFLMRTGVSSFFFIPQSGFRLSFFPTSLSAALWINPDDRKDDVAFFRDFLRPGDTIVDVGANIGSLTLQAAVIAGETGKVLAVEPHPRIFNFQRQNLALNHASQVEAHNVALGEATGRLHFSDDRSDDQNAVRNDDGGIVIPVRTLDSLASGLPEITLLKIDVEGYELSVLNGAAQTLTRTACVFYESWEEHLKRWGLVTGDIIRRLEQAGFQVFSGIKERRLQRAFPDHVSAVCEDLVAVRTPSVLLDRMACVLN